MVRHHEIVDIGEPIKLVFVDVGDGECEFGFAQIVFDFDNEASVVGFKASPNVSDRVGGNHECFFVWVLLQVVGINSILSYGDPSLAPDSSVLGLFINRSCVFGECVAFELLLSEIGEEVSIEIIINDFAADNGSEPRQMKGEFF